MKSPVTIFIFIFLGAIISSIVPNHISLLIGGFGDAYLNLIEMTIIPIVLCSIISSVSKLVQNEYFTKLSSKIIGLSFFLLLITCCLSLLFAYFAKLGVLDEKFYSSMESIILNNNSIKEHLYKLEPNINIKQSNKMRTSHQSIELDELNSSDKDTILSLFRNNISYNIMTSIVLSNIIEIVIFCIIFGIALGKVSFSLSDPLILIFDQCFRALQLIINWFMYILPISIFCISVKQFATVGIHSVVKMSYFVICFFIFSSIILIISFFVIYWTSKESFLVVFFAFTKNLFISFTTRNTFVCIPIAIETLTKNLKFLKNDINLMIPLTVTLVRFGNIMYFSFIIIFGINIYNIDLDIMTKITLPLYLVLASMVTIGTSGFATLQSIKTLTLVTGIPLEAILLILFVIDPVIDPIRTSLTVILNLSMTSLVSKKYIEEDKGDLNVNQNLHEEINLTEEIESQFDKGDI